MRVKHGARLNLTVKTGRRVLRKTTVPVEDLNGALTVISYTYNGRIDGGVAWRDIETGASIRKPTVKVALVDPSDELTGDALCDCGTCTEES